MILEDKITEKLKNTKNILLGGGGFIGTNLQEQFPKIDFEVFDINFKKDLSSENNIYYHKDLSNSFFMENIKELKDINNIFVLAANLGINKVIEDKKYLQKEMNLQLNMYNNIQELIKNFPDKKFNIIYFSTSEVYGNSELMKEESYSVINLKEDYYKRRRYSDSKLLMEDMYQELNSQFDNLNLLIIRPFNVVGKYQDESFVIPRMILDAKLNNEINVFDGKQTRSFIHTTDFNIYLLGLLILKINNDDNISRFNTFNIANLKNYVTIYDLAQIIQKVFFKEYELEININIDTEKSSNDNIIGSKKRIPEISRTYELTDYISKKNLLDIINELVHEY